MAELAQEAFGLSRELANCETWNAIGELFSGGVRTLGLTCSASGMVTGPRAISGSPFHFTDWPHGWQEIYLTRNFLQKDPLPRYALISGFPATWTSVIEKLPSKDAGNEVYKAGLEWGFTEGVAIPLRNQVGDIGLVTAGGDRGPLTLDEIDFIKVISSSAFQAAESLNAQLHDEQSLFTFTRRELDCIILLRAGMTDAQIAKILSVAKSTIVTHIENAREKVNARSRVHLVAITASLTSPAGR